MKKLINVGRIFYGAGVCAIGFQQLFHNHFFPVLLPAWPSMIPGEAIVCRVAGAALMIAGAAIALEKKTRKVSLVLGGVFLLICFLAFGPYEIMIDPYGDHLGSWTNALKLFALAGGAFIVAGGYRENAPKSSLDRQLAKLVPFGRIFFSTTMICFGISHFLYLNFVVKLVPDWIPGPFFWTRFAGVALIASGIAIILKIKTSLVALLLGLMIFLWLILLHIPRAIADPFTGNGNEVISVMEALAFSGIGFMLAGQANKSAINS